MATQGIEGIYVETHNWGRTARFFRELGFEIEFETDHGSGILRCGDGLSAGQPGGPCSGLAWRLVPLG